MSIKRIYHPYWTWEEVNYNMWGKVADRDLYLKTAIEFTGNHQLYGAWMMQVIRVWKYSVEHNLSDRSQNRKAWIGHAACALSFRCPEDIVRKAWSYLDEDQQRLANQQAEQAIAVWEGLQESICQSAA